MGGGEFLQGLYVPSSWSTAYGYEVALRYDAAGEVMHGELAINPNHATVIRRIYDDYVGGRSPRAIAIALNKEAVIGPSGKG